MRARRVLRWATGIAVRALLALYPRDFRRRFGDDVLVESRDDLRGATSTAASFRTAFSVLVDVAGGLAAEHLSAVRGRTSVVPSMNYQSIRADLKLAARRLRV